MTDYIRITPEGHIRVTDAAPFDYIVSYVPFPDINKMVGDPIALPNTATVTRKSGKVETLIVNWEPVSTEFAGTFDISGSVGNGAGVVTQKLIVTLKKKIVSYVNFLDVPVKQYEDTAFRMPMTAYVTYDDGTDGTADIVWGAHSTDVAGSFDIPGIATDAEGLTIDVTVKLVVTALTDLDILRQIRDANPTSQLPTLWAENKDPYTQWWDAENELGVLFGGDVRLDQFAIDYEITMPPIAERDPLKAYVVSIYALDISTLQNVNKLVLYYLACQHNQLTSLDVAWLTELHFLDCSINQLTILNVTGLTALKSLRCSVNQLASIPSLTSKGLITAYNFRNNNFPTAELDRFRAMGFTDESRLLPQNP